MSSRYDALTELLEGRDESSVELSFDELGRLVGCLPDSARRHSAWWANSRTSQPHARFWLDAGRRAQVDFAGERVTFVLGGESLPQARGAALAPVELTPTGEHHAAVAFEWLDAGDVTLGADGVPVIPTLPAAPGVYRFRLTDNNGTPVGTYVGESSNLARRMSGYRTPGPTQSTNIRINERIVNVVSTGGAVALTICVAATLDGVALDLGSKQARLVIESLAILSAVGGGELIENL